MHERGPRGGCAHEAMSVRGNPMACKETSETQGGECTLCAKRASASATHLLRGAPGFFCTADLEGKGVGARDAIVTDRDHHE